jgi:hypothetical protein
VTGEPPLLSGALHTTRILASPAVPLTLRGAVGTPNGVMASDAVEAAELPRAFVALTVKV